MTKYYFRLALLVGSIIGFFALIGALLPRSYSINCQIQIDAPPIVIFRQINDLHNWSKWSSWNPDRIDGLIVNVVGVPGEGNAMQWQDRRGEGKLWITNSQPGSSIDYRLRFDRFPEMTSQMLLTDQGETTLVEWTSKGRLPNGPFYGYLAPFFPTHLRYEYDDCLVRLKTLVEETASSSANTTADDSGEDANENAGSD